MSIGDCIRCFRSIWEEPTREFTPPPSEPTTPDSPLTPRLATPLPEEPTEFTPLNKSYISPPNTPS